MFVGRNQELKKLNQMYASSKLEVAIIYGRRRVGKTTLIAEFCQNRRAIFFAAQESSAEQNLTMLSNAISVAANGSPAASRLFPSFMDAFMEVAQMAADERLILVIDEYPYLAAAERSISSLLQNFIDHQFKNTQLFLILCGSSMSFMEHQVLGHQSPLYGRRTAQFKLMPFDYRETGEWFSDYSYAEKAIMYGVTGGIPLYLEQFSPTSGVQENLLMHFFEKNAILFEEPATLLKQELREPATYNAIVTAIASGKTKLSEIASAVGMDTGSCTKYITNLITLGIVSRETPVTELTTKRPLYLISDQFFRFWFSFMPRNMSAVLSGRMPAIFDMTVGSRLPDYMGLAFEAMCRDYLLYYENDPPFPIGPIGQWWGTNPHTKKQAQIDVVALSATDNRCLVGSCKFRNAPVGQDELTLLKEYAQALGAYQVSCYYLFSKSGFTEGLQEKATREPIRLVTLADLYNK